MSWNEMRMFQLIIYIFHYLSLPTLPFSISVQFSPGYTRLNFSSRSDSEEEPTD